MKKVGLYLLAVVTVVLFSVTSEAATSLVGTWAGSGSCSTPAGYMSLSLTMKVLNQNTAGLFRGSCTGKVGSYTFTETMTGYISGAQVHVSGYTAADGLGSLWELTYAATVPPSMRGYVRGTDGGICSLTVKKR